MSRRPKSQADQPRLSLRFELGLIAEAIDGARALGNFARHGHADSPAHEQIACAGVSAVLTLAVLRLRLLDAVLGGDASASQLAAQHNIVESGDDSDCDALLDISKGGE